MLTQGALLTLCVLHLALHLTLSVSPSISPSHSLPLSRPPFRPPSRPAPGPGPKDGPESYEHRQPQEPGAPDGGPQERGAGREVSLQLLRWFRDRFHSEPFCLTSSSNSRLTSGSNSRSCDIISHSSWWFGRSLVPVSGTWPQLSGGATG